MSLSSSSSCSLTSSPSSSSSSSSSLSSWLTTDYFTSPSFLFYLPWHQRRLAFIRGEISVIQNNGPNGHVIEKRGGKGGGGGGGGGEYKDATGEKKGQRKGGGNGGGGSVGGNIAGRRRRQVWLNRRLPSFFSGKVSQGTCFIVDPFLIWTHPLHTTIHTHNLYCTEDWKRTVQLV